MDKLKKLGSALTDDRSCLQRYTRPGWQSIELFTFIAGKRDDTPLLSLPAMFHPYDESLGWDYGRVFSDEEDVHSGGGDAHERYGIDAGVGCVVCCRPRSACRVYLCPRGDCRPRKVFRSGHEIEGEKCSGSRSGLFPFLTINAHLSR